MTKRMRTYMVLGMALLLSGCLFISSGWAAEQEVISFVTRNDGGNSIQLINTQGAFLQRLMVEGPIAHFTWSPHGRSIAYSSNRNAGLDIYVMDVEANTHRQLTFDDGKDWWPVWSPNGKWIAFASNRAGEMDLYRMDATGENVKRLTNQGACKRPAWSPDSRWIAFVSKSFLFLMSAEGRGVRRLADTFSNGCTWSPDGKEIAFVPRWDAVGGLALFSINVDDKSMRQLTQLYKGRKGILEPTWSPDGKWIAYLLVQLPEVLPEGGGLAEEVFGNSVICFMNTADIGGGEPFEATRKLVGSDLQWVPAGFLSVSPGAEKRITFWGSLKQSENAAK